MACLFAFFQVNWSCCEIVNNGSGMFTGFGNGSFCIFNNYFFTKGINKMFCSYLKFLFCMDIWM